MRSGPAHPTRASRVRRRRGVRVVVASLAFVAAVAPGCASTSDDAGGEGSGPAASSSDGAPAVEDPSGGVAAVDSTEASAGTASSTPPVSADDADDPADPVGDSAKRVARTVDGAAEAAGLADGVEPSGFTTVTARITSRDGEVCDVCLWLADDATEQGRGLMGVTDLGEPVGMAFVWPTATSSEFYMFRTPMPLSIAWFAPDGELAAQTDMTPCPGPDSLQCVRYRPDQPYSVAVEMVRGESAAVGIGAGATVEVLAGTESPTCQAPPIPRP